MNVLLDKGSKTVKGGERMNVQWEKGVKGMEIEVVEGEGKLSSLSVRVERAAQHQVL